MIHRGFMNGYTMSISVFVVKVGLWLKVKHSQIKNHNSQCKIFFQQITQTCVIRGWGFFCSSWWKLDISTVMLLVLQARAHVRLSKRQWRCVLGSEESTFQLVLLRKTDNEFSVSKSKGSIQTFMRDRCRSKRLSWFWEQQSKQHQWWADVKVPLKANFGSVQTYILPSNWCL